MYVATDDQILDITQTLLGLGAKRLSEHRFEIFGLCLLLDGTMAHVVPTEDEPTIEGLAARFKRLASEALAFGLFAMAEVRDSADACLFTMAVEARGGHSVCSFGLLARGPDGTYDVEAGCHLPRAPALFVTARH